MLNRAPAGFGGGAATGGVRDNDRAADAHRARRGGLPQAEPAPAERRRGRHKTLGRLVGDFESGNIAGWAKE